VQQADGMAFVEDDVEHAKHITKQWHIWHASTQRLRSQEAEREHAEQEKKLGNPEPMAQLLLDPIDEIKVSSVVGFMLEYDGAAVQASSKGRSSKRKCPKQGLMIRHKDQLYGRPVYEGDSGNQFLYWMAKGGSYDEGIDFEIDVLTPGKHFEKPGYWALATEIGVDFVDDRCLAYSNTDSVIPPYLGVSQQLHSAWGAPWWVRKSHGAWGYGTYPDSALRFRIKPWSHDKDLRDYEEQQQGRQSKFGTFESLTFLNKSEARELSSSEEETGPLLGGAGDRGQGVGDLLLASRSRDFVDDDGEDCFGL